MKLVIAGSRTINDYSSFDIHQICCSLPKYPDVVLCGMAKGADMMGWQFAHDYMIDCEEYPALWNPHGKQAGMIRNRIMAQRGDALLAFWDGSSRGTAD